MKSCLPFSRMKKPPTLVGGFESWSILDLAPAGRTATWWVGYRGRLGQKISILPGGPKGPFAAPKQMNSGTGPENRM